MEFIKIIKHTNCYGKNNQSGKGVTKYAGVKSEKLESNGTMSKMVVWLRKDEAIKSGLPIEIDNMYMSL